MIERLQIRKAYSRKVETSSSIKSDSTKDEIFLENVPKLSDEEKISCEGLLTLEECSNIVSALQNNK